ncbi:MAG TPA: hypothetical protein VEW42_06620 [Candidatus Eisenbacteria bacterium]|nr:hypothetical protein [Candidatus Eisenbacteria bacterium]
MNLREAITQVQKVGLQHGFTIVIVGGALTRLIGPKTTIKKIDTDKKIIYLEGAENPGVIRGEDGKTIVDIDAIAFSNENDPFSKEVKEAFYHLKKALRELQKSTKDFPAISLEPVLYHPHFPKPNQLTQFVSSIESYHDHDYFFRLGTIKQDVQKKSLSFWTYSMGSDNIVSLSPLAIQRRYAIRGFSIKPKDKDKMWNPQSPFVQFLTKFTAKTDGVYEKCFTEWDEFSTRVTLSAIPSMRLKKGLWDAYWTTIGTYLAHGTGRMGKLLLPLGNTFFAGK